MNLERQPQMSHDITFYVAGVLASSASPGHHFRGRGAVASALLDHRCCRLLQLGH